MKNIIKALIPGIIACSIAGAVSWANYAATAGSGTNFYTFTATNIGGAGTIHIPAFTVVDTTGNQVIGASSDASYTSGNGSVISLLKGIYTQVSAAIPAGTAVIGYTTNDPCTSSASHLNAVIKQNTNAQVITGTSAKKTYICSIALITGAAVSPALIAGTGTVCNAGDSNIIGGSPALSGGLPLAANGGLTYGNGAASVAIASNANADNICLVQSGTAPINGNITYVQQ